MEIVIAILTGPERIKKLPHPSFKVSIASQSIFRRLDCYLDQIYSNSQIFEYIGPEYLFGHLFVSIFYMNLFSGRLDSYLDQADRHDIVADMGSQYRKRKVGVVNTVRNTSWDVGTCAYFVYAPTYWVLQVAPVGIQGRKLSNVKLSFVLIYIQHSGNCVHVYTCTIYY